MNQNCNGCHTKRNIEDCILKSYEEVCPCSICLIKMICHAENICQEVRLICTSLHREKREKIEIELSYKFKIKEKIKKWIQYRVKTV